MVDCNGARGRRVPTPTLSKRNEGRFDNDPKALTSLYNAADLAIAGTYQSALTARVDRL
jgi:hypothetical protein